MDRTSESHPEPTLSEDRPARQRAQGLTQAEAQLRLARYGPNGVDETLPPYWRTVVSKFWAPIPWLLEAAIALQIAAGAYLEAAIVAALLAFNVVLGLVQERRAAAALAALTKRLEPQARVRRDGRWMPIPAAALVPGDLIDLSLGRVVPADACIDSGWGSVDQSALTGESVPAEVEPGQTVYAGSLVRRGAMRAVVTATGVRTYFGRAAQLVKLAHAPSAEQRAVFDAVRALALINGVVALGMLAYAHSLGLAPSALLRVAITALLATVPVALPATFALSASLSALVLSRSGALLTRLSAVHEAASMNVLCSDKTGTLTENRLSVERIVPLGDFDAEHVLAYAATACDDTDADALDAAINRAASHTGAGQFVISPDRRVPFDPQTKIAQAWGTDAQGRPIQVVKGALQAVERLTGSAPTVRAASDELAAQGYRVIAVAIGRGDAVQLIGLIALSDPPRGDAGALIGELASLGVRTLMVTGDSPATASSIARQLGLRETAGRVDETLDASVLANCDVYARVLPEDKYRLVQTLQREGQIVGMCGDGANDAPALRQAQVGVAVSSATDVAKAAAAIVLTEPGLGGIVAVIKEGRRAYRRLLTYALNMLVKKIEVVFLLAFGLVTIHAALLTLTSMVILLVTNDFLTMSLTTDRTVPSPRPCSWNMSSIAVAAAVIGIAKLAFSAALVLVAARYRELPIDRLQTLAFVAIAFGNQATLYALRASGRLWRSRPSAWLAGSSVVDVAVVSTVSLAGLGMARIPLALVGRVALAAAIFALLLDRIKQPLMRAARIE